MIIWICGLSGSGKTSTALALSALFDKVNKQNLVLDGNHLRKIFNEKGYDKASRIALGIKYAQLAHALSDEKIIIIAANGMIGEVSAYCREHLGDFVEVFLDVPSEVLFRRDSNNLYSRFKAGEAHNVSGLDLPVDTPNADICFKYNPKKSATQIAKEIFTFLQNKSTKNIAHKTKQNAILSTKAQTLQNLQPLLKLAKILPIFTITRGDLPKKTQNLKEILRQSKEKSFIVRSSANNEDTLNSSNAGAFLSIANVQIKDIESSIKKVLNSYSAKSKNDCVLIQPMAKNIAISGVAFNYEPKYFAPYFVIEYALNSTSAVTSGANNVKKYTHSRIAKNLPKDKFMAKVIALFNEIEALIPQTALDLEFGITKNGEIYLFQLRPLIIKNTPKEIDSHTLLTLENKISAILKKQIFLQGKNGILSVMSDWNPAEIIGLHPRTLAFSLYKELITDSIWAHSRASLGYKNVAPHPLIYNLQGFAFVDVRASFNSFLPQNLNEKIAEKLVNYYLEQLRQNPHLHDKIEFEIIFCGYYFDSDKRLQNLKNFNFLKFEIDEIRASLQNLTCEILRNKPYLEAIRQIDILSSRRKKALTLENKSEAIFWLLEDCKVYGTKNFAILARMGFMAVRFLDALLNLGILKKEQKDNFINSLQGITTEFNADLANLTKEAFLEKYGHLRPGTYDILSPSYNENYDIYFKNITKNKHTKKAEFNLSLAQIKQIENMLSKANLDISVVEFFEFIAMGILQRERSKFEFSKNISEILRLIGEIGAEFRLSKDDLSFCDIGVFTKAFSTSENIQKLILESISKNKSTHFKQQGLLMPSIIFNANDIYGFYDLDCAPNFITQKRIRAEVLAFSKAQNLDDKIICIECADPGFDFIFSHNIAGLITRFGGANSHMAIRANELGIPAVIGCGKNFDMYKNAKILDINCANAKVEIVL
ncbi:adenylyl-sulfate kinase [Helicobacter sp. 23-1045]